MVIARKSNGVALALWLVAGLVLAGCGNVKTSDRPPQTTQEQAPDDPNRATIFGPGGISNLFSSPREGEGGIGVNTFLWRASLDTIAFMPINSADAFGGVIITDWYTFQESGNERFKLNVYILGRALRADGVRVSAFRQAKDADGTWKDAAVPKETAARIEDAILTRARQLRQETLAQQQR
jgi:hypothetical protein